ncbi:MAG: hypothetical protein K2W95_02550 [Candidatus Obscuribacterales bacterium]|nr:hypothetical protein [Candidatus Obscuribacterales bacterium]
MQIIGPPNLPEMHQAFLTSVRQRTAECKRLIEQGENHSHDSEIVSALEKNFRWLVGMAETYRYPKEAAKYARQGQTICTDAQSGTHIPHTELLTILDQYISIVEKAMIFAGDTPQEDGANKGKSVGLYSLRRLLPPQ